MPGFLAVASLVVAMLALNSTLAIGWIIAAALFAAAVNVYAVRDWLATVDTPPSSRPIGCAHCRFKGTVLGTGDLVVPCPVCGR